VKLNRLRIRKEVAQRLITLKARTGLTPNILCRIGFCLSLTDPTMPSAQEAEDDGERPAVEKEINRHTLTGQWDPLFVALIKERCHRDGLSLDDEALADHFCAHIDRGVLLLYKRVRTLNDLARLMPQVEMQEE
jgi:DNA sulfur modification protein DndE